MSPKQKARKYLKKMDQESIAAQILDGLIFGLQLRQLRCVKLYYTTAGQQRLNELRRAGLPIRTKWEQDGKKRYKVYYL